jgi:hypothetical protein
VRTLRAQSTIGLSVRDLLEDRKHDRKVVEASTARIVVASLNSKPNERTERVIGLIESCHRISQMIEAIKTSGGGSSSEQNAQVSSAVVDLNRRLGKYKWHPYVSGSMSAESHFRIHYSIVSVAFDQEVGIEHFAVQWIVENVDAVHKIRRCRVQKCRKWFYAKTDHQKYCGETCRKKDASQGESFKEHRRVYMKRYRKEEAARDARAMRLAKGKTK